jgi:hypothetical protein
MGRPVIPAQIFMLHTRRLFRPQIPPSGRLIMPSLHRYGNALGREVSDC